MEHQPLSVESASDVSDGDDGFTTRTKKVLKTPFRLLAVSVLLGTMALAGVSHFGLPRTTREQHLSPLMKYKNLMMAFSAHLHPSKISKTHVNTFLKAFTERMLQDNDEFTGTLKALINQKGAADPSKMSLKLITVAPTDKGPRQMLRIKLLAKPGQQAKLIDDVKKMSGQSVKAEEPNLAVVELPLPEGAGPDLVEAMKSDAQTDIELELGVSKTLEEIHADKEKNVVEAIGGVKLSATAKTANAIFGALKKTGQEEGMNVDGPVDEVDHFMEGIASLGFSAEMLYKSPDKFADMPTLMQEFDGLKAMVGDLKKPAKCFIKNLPTTCDGIDGVTLSGGSMPKEFAVKFTNFKPMALVADIIEELDSELTC